MAAIAGGALGSVRDYVNNKGVRLWDSDNCTNTFTFKWKKHEVIFMSESSFQVNIDEYEQCFT